MTLTDAEGNPLDGATLLLNMWDYGSGAWMSVTTGTTDATGAYTFTGLTSGQYVVRAQFATNDDYLPTENHWSAQPGESLSLVMNENHYDAATRGSSTCLLCHDGGIASDTTGWKGTLHSLSLRVPGETSDLQDLSIWPDADIGLGYFEPGNAMDNTGSGDDYGYKFDLTDATYYVWMGRDSTGYFAKFSNATDTIFSDRFDVTLTQGGEGKYKQRFWVRIDEATKLNAAAMGPGVGHYVLPIQYNETAEGTTYDPIWVSYNASRWAEPTVEGGSAFSASMAKKNAVESSCSGCHFNDLTVTGNTTDGFDASSNRDDGSNYDWDGDGHSDEIDMGCESCHGPGGDHAGNPNGVMNPAYMTADAATLVCGRCHTRGESVWEETSTGFGYEFPWTEEGEAPKPGLDEDLSTSYIAAPGRWTDATGAATIYSKQHHQQYDDYLHSTHTDNPYVRLTCFSCHDVHTPSTTGQITSRLLVKVDGLEEELTGVANADNTLCLGCHAGHGDFAAITLDDVRDVIDDIDDSMVGDAVTYHTDLRAGMGGTAFYDPEGTGFGSCSSCHMPRTAASARYSYNEEGEKEHGDVGSHSFGIILPSVSKAMEDAGISSTIPNSCGSCHSEWVY